MNGEGASVAGGTSVALALGLWLAALAPQWILLVWGVKHLDALQEAAARHLGWKLLVAGCWTAAVLLAFVGTVLVWDLLGPDRLEIQRFTETGTLVQEGLLVVAGLLLVSRRKRGRAAASKRGDSARTT